MAKICLVRQQSFTIDPRIRQEVDALVQAGHKVDVICMQRPGEALHERCGEVTIWRLPMKHYRGQSPLRYFFEYSSFWILATMLLSALHIRNRYNLVQVNTIPDTLVFTAFVPRLLGARVLVDLYECMPE